MRTGALCLVRHSPNNSGAKDNGLSGPGNINVALPGCLQLSRDQTDRYMAINQTTLSLGLMQCQRCERFYDSLYAVSTEIAPRGVGTRNAVCDSAVALIASCCVSVSWNRACMSAQLVWETASGSAC